MGGYSIGEVELITGMKSHILRYWEELIPSLAPHKDVGGHREYTQREVDIIRRLKYLIYTDGFSIENAWKKIVHESSSSSDVILAIRKCRAELNQAYVALKQLERRRTFKVENPSENSMQVTK